MSRGLVLVLVLCLSPALASLGDELMDVDPAQYADVAARIVSSGDWLHLEDMNGPFINKPPLVLWAEALAMEVLGPTSLAARLPALGFALLAVLGTFFLGLELADRRLGALAAALLAGSVAVHLGVADPKVDLALAAMTTWAIGAAVAARRRPRWMVLAWLFAGLAVLTKGPVGLGIVLLALVPELSRGVSSGLPGERLRATGRHLVGVALFVAVVLPFYASQNPDAARYLLWTQGFGRLLGGGDFHDTTTPLFFVHTGLWALLPMTPLLIAALARGVTRLRRERTLPPDVRRVPAWWFGLTFLVISFSAFKLPQYLYWLAPPAALLAADELLRWHDETLGRWRTGYLALSVGAAALALGLLAFAFPPPAALAAGLGAASLLPALAWWLARKEERALRMGALAASSCVGFFAIFHAWLHPSLLEFQPWREVGAAVQSLPSGAPVLLVDVPKTFALSFYARRTLRPASREDVAAEAPARFVVSAQSFEALRSAGAPVESVRRLPLYPVSLPRGPFLRASTRETQLEWLVVAQWR